MLNVHSKSSLTFKIYKYHIFIQHLLYYKTDAARIVIYLLVFHNVDIINQAKKKKLVFDFGPRKIQIKN